MYGTAAADRSCCNWLRRCATPSTTATRSPTRWNRSAPCKPSSGVVLASPSTQVASGRLWGMTTSSSQAEGGSAGGVSENPLRVVWWRQTVTALEVPRSHRIGWSVLGDGRRGVLTVMSPHLRLDRGLIERELSAALTSELGTAVRVMPVAECVDQLDPATRLAVAGHTLFEADLASTFGLDVIAGVTAELLGKGVSARVVVEATLSVPIRAAVLEWAEAAIDQFVQCNGDELLTAGWQQLTSTRWQLLAVQAG